MNAEIIKLFDELRQIADLLGEDYKAKAYHSAISAIVNIPFTITADNLDTLRDYKGIGPGILNKITEFVKTGGIGELNTLRGSELVRAHRELGKIIGVGPATIKKWLKLGVNSLPTLRRAVGSGLVSLNNMQKWGLKYYTDLNMRIPRDEVYALGNYVKGAILQSDPDAIFEIAGSYRRGLPDSGDIDILVSNKKHFDETLLPSVMELLAGDRNFIDVLSAGSERVTFLYRSPVSRVVRQIDILNITYGSYYAALLYFTGSWGFNEKMRGWAKSKGYRLNQAGLFRVYSGRANKVKTQIIPTKNEEEIFKLLGLKYVPPNLRDGNAVKPA